MKIDILSDPICPWCYIGNVKLNKAVKSYARPLGDLVTNWRAFQLNPDMPLSGMDRQLYLERKFGGAERAAEFYGRINQAGKEIGINFKFSDIRKTPNTLKAHRLLRYAAGALQSNPSQADTLNERLFKAYFEEGVDIGNTNELAFLASQCGLDRDQVTAFLMGNDFQQEIIDEDETARRAGVTGVPFFIINDHYALSGAQPVEAFHRVFDLVLEADKKLAN